MYTRGTTVNTNLVPQKSLVPDHFLEDVLAHMGVHSTQGIIQHIDVSVVVDGTGQTHSLFLSATQVYTLLFKSNHEYFTEQYDNLQQYGKTYNFKNLY